METLFLNTIQAISDSRFWLMPLLFICIFIMDIIIIKEVITDDRI
jgi:hypothetical protein